MTHARAARGGEGWGRALALLVAAVLLAAPSASARILKTRSAKVSDRPLALTVGSGFEYETDGEESEYGFPFLAEYALRDWIKLRAEPSFVLVRKKAGGVISGPGDLETAVALEFPTERRHRPGLGLEGIVKWPTAPRGDLGTGKTDFTLGGIVSKEFVRFDLDLNAAYTWVGDPPGLSLKDTFEASVAGEWRLNSRWSLESEVVTAGGAGGRFRSHTITRSGFANIGGPEQGQSESEWTIGVIQQRSEWLKVEAGVVMKSGNSYQFLFAWEWDFGGGR